MPRRGSGPEGAIETESSDVVEEQAPGAGQEMPEPEPLLPVRVIERRGGSCLVEWVAGGEAHRAFIPPEAWAPEGVTATVLERGVPYGVPWQDIRLPGGDLPAALARELHNAGIWTRQDLVRNQRAAMGAVQAALGLHLGALNRFAHDREV